MFILSDSFALPIHNIVELYAAKISKMFSGLPVQQIVNNRRIYMVKTFLQRITVCINSLVKPFIFVTKCFT
jgi:hypothetical protein